LKKLVLAVLLAAAAGAIVWGVLRKNEPPRVKFARAKRQRLVSTLATNGKVEPYEWRAVYAESSGILSRLDLHEGAGVAQGAVIAVVADPSVQGEIDAAEARLTQARANLQTLEAGARPADVASIDASIARARLDQAQAEKERAAINRLLEKQAATRAEVTALDDKINQLKLETENLEKRRNLPPSLQPEVAAGRARVQEAQAAVAAAHRRESQSAVLAPMGGVAYGVAVKPGAFVHAGDLLANIGSLNRVRVRVYVDEPELGRVELGQPVTIRWQAMPGKEWQGSVERKPVSIEALGSRQVGEVVCTIDNQGRELTPGANVDAEIRTSVSENALVIPREAMRHDAGGDYVFALHGDSIERRVVKPGAASVALVEVTGLADGDAVALPSDVSLKPGDRVTPVL
jgi:HlyD family secretion protein